MMHISAGGSLERGLANVVGALALGVSDRLSSESDAAALVTLLERGDLTIDWLRRIVGLSHSAAVRLVDRLAGDGLVKRQPGRDRRSVLVRLTTRGKAAAKGLRLRRQAQLEELVAPLSQAERETLLALAEKLCAAMVAGRWQARFVCRLCDHGACVVAGGCPVDRAASLAGE